MIIKQRLVSVLMALCLGSQPISFAAPLMAAETPPTVPNAFAVTIDERSALFSVEPYSEAVLPDEGVTGIFAVTNNLRVLFLEYAVEQDGGSEIFTPTGGTTDFWHGAQYLPPGESLLYDASMTEVGQSAILRTRLDAKAIAVSAIMLLMNYAPGFAAHPNEDRMQAVAAAMQSVEVTGEEIQSLIEELQAVENVDARLLLVPDLSSALQELFRGEDLKAALEEIAGQLGTSAGAFEALLDVTAQSNIFAAIARGMIDEMAIAVTLLRGAGNMATQVKVEAVTAASVKPLAPPRPLSPVGAIREQRPRFEWNAAPRARSYRLEISDDPDFATNVLSADVAGTSHTPADDFAVDTTFYWRIAAVNSTGDSSQASTIGFTTYSQSTDLGAAPGASAGAAANSATTTAPPVENETVVTPTALSELQAAVTTPQTSPLAVEAAAVPEPLSSGASFADDFSGSSAGSPPVGWSQRGNRAITPIVVARDGISREFNILEFPKGDSQLGPAYSIHDGVISSSAYTVEVKLRYLDVGERAGITLAMDRDTLSRIDIQPNLGTGQIEIRSMYGGSVERDVPTVEIRAGVDYWLRVAVEDANLPAGKLTVYWSDDGLSFTKIAKVIGLSSVIGEAGLSTAGAYLPHVQFDEFAVTFAGRPEEPTLVLVDEPTPKAAQPIAATGPVSTGGRTVVIPSTASGASIWSADGAKLLVPTNVSGAYAAIDPASGSGTETVRLGRGEVEALGSNPPATLSPDGQWGVRQDDAGQFVLVDLASGAERSVGSGVRMAWSPDSRRVAVVDSAGNAAVWSIDTGDRLVDLEPVAAFAAGTRGKAGSGPLSLAWSPDGAAILYTERRGAFLCIWQSETGAIMRCTETETNAAPTAAWALDSEHIVVLLDIGSPGVYDIAGDEFRTIGDQSFSVVGGLSADGSLLALGTDASRFAPGPVRVYDVATGELLYKLDGAYTNPVWSRNGRMLAIEVIENELPSGRLVWWLDEEVAATDVEEPAPSEVEVVVTPASAVTIGIDEVFVPAGPFEMGCGANDSACAADEAPLHAVNLDAYYIDTYEVTNSRYAACVSEGACTPPQKVSSWSRSSYYGDPQYAEYPVINTDWVQANAFCAWDGKRLPTEAEWEKAARGDSDTRIYPWGDEAPGTAYLNADYIAGDTTRVGSYPAGASPYGVMDMAGNVLEETSDWYLDSYYSVSPASNPAGAESGEFHVLRGGAWCNNGEEVRLANRSITCEIPWTNFVGFRCARSHVESGQADTAASDSSSTNQSNPELTSQQAAEAPATSSGPTANDNANLRSGPGTAYDKVGRVTAGTPLQIVARNEGGDWFKLADGSWIAAFLVELPPASLPILMAPPLPAPPVTAPLVTAPAAPSVATCSIPAASDLAGAYSPALGCATGTAAITWASHTPFERGFTIWRQDNNKLYGFFSTGAWLAANDDWDGVTATPSRGYPPAGTHEPVRGAGYIWGTNDVFFNQLGWATLKETGFCARIQHFENGFILRSSATPQCHEVHVNPVQDDNFLFLTLFNNGAWTRR